MPTLIARPTVIKAAGNKPKSIKEFAGRVNSGHAGVSVAQMASPEGWVEPGQRPEFEEITVVLRGVLRVEHAGGPIDVKAGQAIVAHPGEWIRYSSPLKAGARYIAECLPAFSPDPVHRDEECRPLLSLAIESGGLRKVFGELVAVDGINLAVPRGSFYGFLGPHGAGKSTTIKCLTGLLKPTAGEFRILDRDPTKEPVAVKKKIGVMPEDLALFDRLTGSETLTFVGQVHG